MSRLHLCRPLQLALAVVAVALAWAVVAPAPRAAAESTATFDPNPVPAGGSVTAHVPLPPPPTDVPQDPSTATALPPLVRAVAEACAVVLDKATLSPTSCSPTATEGVLTFVVPTDTTPGTHTVGVRVGRTVGFGSLEVTPPVTTVPELRPLEVSLAAQSAAAVDLTLCQPVKASGFVLQQSPPPNAQVRAGSCVTVVVEDGIDVPNLKGLTRPEAEKKLAGDFLTLVASDSEGTIATQDPAPHTIVPPLTAVTVTLVVTPPSTSTPSAGDTSPGNATSSTPSAGVTPSAEHPTPTVLPTGPTEQTGFTLPLPSLLGAVLALLVAFVVGGWLVRRRPGRRRSGAPPWPPSPPSTPSRPAPAVGLRVRADRGDEPRLVDADTVAGARVGLTSVPDHTVEPVLVEDLS